MALDFRQLRYFIAVAEARHFGRAAEQLEIVQPALSMQVAALERHLGARLLDRTHRRVTLTQAGALFLAEARATLAQAERAERVGRQAGRGETGLVSLGYVGSAPFSPAMASLLHRLRSDDPGIALHLAQLPAAAQLGGLASGEIDLGLVRSPMEALPDMLGTLALSDEAMVVALPANHAAATARELTLASLSQEPFINYAPQGAAGLYSLVRDACQAAGFEPRVVQTVPQIATIACLVAAGLGIALVPESVARLRLPGMTARPLAAAPRTTLMLVYRRDERSPAALALLRHGRAVAADKRG